MSGNVFIIPYAENLYIVYLPIQGIILKCNAATVNLLNAALEGDTSAMEKLGLTEAETEQITCVENDKPALPSSPVKFKPTAVTLFLTTGCSMNCLYCYASAGEKNVHIKHEYIEAAVDEITKNALELGQNRITINYHGGGDIGVVWNIVESATAYIKQVANKLSLKTKFTIGSNGVLSCHQRKWILENISSATVSMDGYKEIQNLLRPLKGGLPSFGIVDDTLKYFDANGFNYALRSTVTSQTVGKLESIVKFFCSNYEVKKIKIEPMFMQGRALRNDLDMPDPDEFVKHFLRAEEIARSYNRELIYSGARFDMITRSFCKANGKSFCVTPKGFLSSCYEVLEESDPASKTFFFGRIINKEIQVDQDRLNRLADFDVESKNKCKNCFAKYHCAGDCPVKSLIAANDQNLSVYRCKINRALTKHQLFESIK
jgi:uncharacterized protein